MPKIYGTLGPRCSDAETLRAMLEAGMSGVRLNLSHITLHDAAREIDNLHRAADESGNFVTVISGRSSFRLQCLPQADFRIRCGKGTYIRSIARDLGLALNSGAFLSALRREQVGQYHLADAVSLDEVERFLLS